MRFHHGTSSYYLETHLKDGLPISKSGFGQSGLTGVGLLPGTILGLVEACGYAQSAAAYSSFQPILLTIELPESLNFKDLRGIQHIHWHYFQQYEDLWQTLRTEKHYAISNILLQEGFDGAIIDSTLGSNRPEEYIVFDPENCHIIDYELLERTRF